MTSGGLYQDYEMRPAQGFIQLVLKASKDGDCRTMVRKYALLFDCPHGEVLPYV